MARTFDLEEPVGRDEELGLADELLRATLADATSRDAHARALLVGGEAGIGKTTLIHALASRASALGLGFTVGHCLDLATGLPFGPVMEALRGHVHHNVLDHVVLPSSAAWLAATAPTAVAGSLEKLLEAAESLAEAAPFVLVLEDLHWADISAQLGARPRPDLPCAAAARPHLPHRRSRTTPSAAPGPRRAGPEPGDGATSSSTASTQRHSPSSGGDARVGSWSSGRSPRCSNDRRAIPSSSRSCSTLRTTACPSSCTTCCCVTSTG